MLLHSSCRCIFEPLHENLLLIYILHMCKTFPCWRIQWGNGLNFVMSLLHTLLASGAFAARQYDIKVPKSIVLAHLVYYSNQKLEISIRITPGVSYLFI